MSVFLWVNISVFLWVDVNGVKSRGVSFHGTVAEMPDQIKLGGRESWKGRNHISQQRRLLNCKRTILKLTTGLQIKNGRPNTLFTSVRPAIPWKWQWHKFSESHKSTKAERTLGFSSFEAVFLFYAPSDCCRKMHTLENLGADKVWGVNDVLGNGDETF